MSSNLERVLRLMAAKSASDVYLAANTPILIKIHGQLLQLSEQVLEQHQTRALLAEMLSPQQLEELDETGELNVGIGMARVGSFRLSAFKQRGSVAAVVRCIPHQIPTLESLGLPQILGDLVTERRGLILMVGATGTGKSTTLASMIEWRNQQMTGHILTIEDPIEFLHTHKKSIVNQREVGLDTHAFHNALKNAMREAPDVILIGEILDSVTMESAIAFAETGHLCLATLHSNNADQTLERILNFFPEAAHKNILMNLSLNLKAVVSLRLVIGKDGKRLPASEILINTPMIRDLIRRGQIHEVKEAMEKSLEAGMHTFDQSLFKLYKEGKIDLEEALRKADSRDGLALRIRLSEGASAEHDPYADVFGNTGGGFA